MFLLILYCIIIGHTGKECLNLLSTDCENISETDVKKGVEKRKAENELMKCSVKKNKIKHSKEIVKQNVLIGRKKILKLKQNKKKLSRIKNDNE